ncbi:MFS transporter [Cohnella herbarum]|uniref:MFS transporter n=1 Tax=Cohnella herbarum TaxID=2728023 RepID=A0A7Z2ZNG2_9BACL|nr:MFS transporter [Cohnella herbarum]QJD85027.1 hypothetical protein HH215_18810 [Cohnella herbarum]
MYYAKYVWGDVNLVSIMVGVGLIPLLIVFLVSGALMKRLGKRNTAILGLVIGTFGILVRMLNPESVARGIAGSLVQAFGMIPLMIVLGPLSSDTIEYREWKHGKRIVGLTNSVNAFGGNHRLVVGVGALQ